MLGQGIARGALGRDRKRRGLEHDLLGSGAGPQATGIVDGGLQRVGRRQRQDDLARLPGHGRAVGGGNAPCGLEPLVSVRVGVVADHLVPGGEQAIGERRPHVAQADETDRVRCIHEPVAACSASDTGAVVLHQLIAGALQGRRTDIEEDALGVIAAGVEAMPLSGRRELRVVLGADHLPLAFGRDVHPRADRDAHRLVRVGVAMHVMDPVGVEVRPPERDRAGAVGAVPDDPDVLKPLFDRGRRRILGALTEPVANDRAVGLVAGSGDLVVHPGERGSRLPGDPEARGVGAVVGEPMPRARRDDEHIVGVHRRRAPGAEMRPLALPHVHDAFVLEVAVGLVARTGRHEQVDDGAEPGSHLAGGQPARVHPRPRPVSRQFLSHGVVSFSAVGGAPTAHSGGIEQTYIPRQWPRQ